MDFYNVRKFHNILSFLRYNLKMRLTSQSGSMSMRRILQPNCHQKTQGTGSVTVLSAQSTQSCLSSKALRFSQNFRTPTSIASRKCLIQAFRWTCYIITFLYPLTSLKRPIKMEMYPQSWTRGSCSSAQMSRIRSCVSLISSPNSWLFTGTYTKYVQIRRISWAFFQKHLRKWTATRLTIW